MKKFLAFFGVLLGLTLLPSFVFADTVVNNVVAGIAPNGDTINSGGSTSVSYWLEVTNGTPADDINGCNATGGTPATGTLSVPANVTVTGGNTLTFDAGCSSANAIPKTFSSNVAGNYPISISVSGGKAGSLYATAGASFTLHVLGTSDTTPPNISYVLSPASPDGSNDWYKSNVTLTWTVAEPESPGSLTKTGCVDQNITADQTATMYSCSATSDGGNSGPVEVTIKRDATKPTISAAISAGTLGSNGWYISNVTVHFSCADDLAGVPGASCPADQVLSSEGSSVSSTAQTATDDAGNVSLPSTVITVKIDKTGPTVELSVSAGTPGTNGWYTSDVTIHTAGTDSVSSPVVCTGDQVQNTETAGATFNGVCTNNAGLTTNAAPLTVKLDKTAPTSVSLGVTAGTLGLNGWYTSDVTVTTSGSESVSTPLVCTAPQIQTTDTAGVTFSGKCTNNAGLFTDAAPLTVKLDKTPPVVNVTGVVNGQTYVLGSVPAAGCSTTDAPSPPQSGVAANAALATSGGPVGSVTVICSGAKDSAGNGATPVSVTYNVIYNWTGFFQPVDNAPTLNSVKAGSAIPVKFSLGGNQGLNIFAANSPSSAIVVCGTTAPDVPIEETVTAGNSSLSYDATANQYVYVWKTDKSWVGQCRQLTVRLIDGTEHKALFKFK